MPIIKKFTLFILLTTLSFTAQALEVIRVDVNQNATSQPVDIQLFDNVVLNTVTNFLSYMDDGSYNNLFINRSVKGFVVQAGGYTYNPTLNDGSFSISANNQFNGGLQPVSAKPAIANEFKLSNLRGTLAMAKISGQPNSATSEWFINLADNTFLDSNNGGFTVFGKVLRNGMTIIDAVAAIPVYKLAAQLNNNGAFAQTPLTNFNSNLTAQAITARNLVYLKNFQHLFKITDTVDFGDAVAGVTVQKKILITNTGTVPLTTGHIGTSTITAPFSIISNNCEKVTLAAGANCAITVKFAPTTKNFFVNTLSVAIASYGYSFPVTLRTPSPEIAVDPNAINFGTQPVFDPAKGLPKQRIIRLFNKGDRDLHLSSISFSGPNSSEFEFIDNCTTAGSNPNATNIVSAGGFCILVVNFKPTDLLEKHAAIKIQSDDPVKSLVTINIVGGATGDNDGIPRAEEDGAPNNGDANNDGLPDGLQDNVVSFINSSGRYSTLVADSGINFTQVTKLSPASFSKLPTGANFSDGIFSFKIAGITPGSAVKVGFINPVNQPQKGFYTYGPTATNAQPHWIQMSSNTLPAAMLLGDASLTNPSGNKITASLSQLIIVDGGDGDGDATANGMITFTGAADIGQPSNSSSGAISLYWLLFAGLISVLRKHKKSRGQPA